MNEGVVIPSEQAKHISVLGTLGKIDELRHVAGFTQFHTRGNDLKLLHNLLHRNQHFSIFLDSYSRFEFVINC